MALSKARMRIRKRLDRAAAKGQPLSQALSNPAEAFAALPLDERYKILKEIALSRIETPVSPTHKIAAIKETNLMTHVYDERPPYQDNRQYNIIVADEQSRESINRLLAGTPRPREIEEK